MKKISLIILIFAFLVLGNEALAASDHSNATISILSQQKKQIMLVMLNKGDGLQMYGVHTRWGWRGAETNATSSPQQIIDPLPAGVRTRWGWRGPADAHLPTPSSSGVTELESPDLALPNPVE